MKLVIRPVDGTIHVEGEVADLMRTLRELLGDPVNRPLVLPTAMDGEVAQAVERPAVNREDEGSSPPRRRLRGGGPPKGGKKRCPECSKLFLPGGLDIHRSKKHGVRGKWFARSTETHSSSPTSEPETETTQGGSSSSRSGRSRSAASAASTSSPSSSEAHIRSSRITLASIAELQDLLAKGYTYDQVFEANPQINRLAVPPILRELGTLVSFSEWGKLSQEGRDAIVHQAMNGGKVPRA